MLQSVAEQRFSDFELIIVDGGSTDHTLDIIREFKDQMNLQYISEPDEGVYDALNKGIKMARGQWLYFLGTDDRLIDKNILSDIFATIDQSGEFDVVYGNIFSEKNNRVVGSTWSHEDWLFKNVCHQGIFYKSILFDTYGLFEIKYKVCGDYAYNLMLWHAGTQWRYINRVIAFFGGQGLSHTQFDSNFHDDKEAILFQPYAHLPKRTLYEAKKYFIYNEIRFKDFWKGIFLLVKLIFYTGNTTYHLRHGAFWIKERILASRN
jgi:glycosyltransferase involved in cell wall biosynthesis